MLNITDTPDISTIGHGQSPTADLLPTIDWTPRQVDWVMACRKQRSGWLVTRSHDSIVIRQGVSGITIPISEATKFLATINRFAGDAP